jgi:propionate catabolism operon transcriptional regulator
MMKKLYIVVPTQAERSKVLSALESIPFQDVAVCIKSERDALLLTEEELRGSVVISHAFLRYHFVGKCLEALPVQYSTSGVLSALQGQARGPKQVVLVLTQGHDVDLELLRRYDPEMDLHVIEIPHNGEKGAFLKQLKEGYTTALVVGEPAVCKAAKKLGLSTAALAMEPVELQKAAMQGLLVYAQQESFRQAVYTVAAESGHKGVLALDNQRRVLMVNDAGLDFLDAQEDDLVGNKAPEALAQAVAHGKEGRMNRPVLCKLNGQKVMARDVGRTVWNGQEVNVLTLYHSEDLLCDSAEVRRQMAEKEWAAEHSYDDIVDQSESIRKAMERSLRFAASEDGVLIVGEEGVGKQMFAESMHHASPRANGPFVPVHCKAISEKQLEVELFGYKDIKPGRVEAAHGGTLYLSDIEQLSLPLQKKLWQMLSTGELYPLEGKVSVPVDVRLMVSSTEDLERWVKDGNFMEELYHMVDTMVLEVPSLWQRKEDIPQLAQNFLAQCGKESHGRHVRIHEDAIIELREYQWRNNVRQLQNICKKLYIENKVGIITRNDVKDVLYDLHEVAKGNLYCRLPSRDDPDYEMKVLHNKRLTKMEIAQLLGISRTTLWRKMKEAKLN